ncbi:MAG: replicative DNA helicase [Bacteroidales bacterium]|jgi:replicative DNA helicase|nr:replicative DNA helicase [Bacteroidales bacterium]
MANESITTKRTEQKINYNTLESTLGVAGKLTPQALEFEMAVLGAILINSDAVGQVVDFLSPRMFYKEAHFHIYRAVRELFDKMEPIDLLTVTSHLRKAKMLEQVGGPSYLASLTNRVASSANIEYHARIVMEKFVLRELINNCNVIIKDAYEDSKDVLQLLDNAETNLFGIYQENFKRDSKELNIVMKKAIEELIEMKNEENQFHGVPCGIRAIDEKTGGWQKSDLIIIAARPGMGKSSFVLTIARNAAIDYKRPVALFSLEMSSSQLVHRLFSIETGIPAERIAKAKLSDDEWTILTNKLGPLNTANLIIDDTPALSVFDLRAKCRRLKHQYDIQLIIVDYLQLMQGGTDAEKGKGNREQEISYISRSLKALAKDLNVPVIALSQLSRAVETRSASKRPQLSDLRESGSIEQDADMVMFIYRPEYYGLATFEDEDVPAQGLADIMIQKNRHGPNANIRIRFQSQYTRFTDIDFGMNADSLFEGIAPNQSFDVYESSMNDDYSDDNRFEKPLTEGIPY